MSMVLGLWIAAYLLVALAALMVKRRPAWALQAVFLGLQTAILAYLFDFGWDLYDSTENGLTIGQIQALPNGAAVFLLPAAVAGALVAFLGRDSLREMGKAPWISLAISWTGALFGAYSFTILALNGFGGLPDWKLIVSVLTA